MPVTRREFIGGLGAIAGLRLLAPVVVRAGAGLGEVVPEITDRNRLVVIFQQGGNDGLNTVIPIDDVDATLGGPRRSVYEAVRPSIAYTREEPLPLAYGGDGVQALGLNPTMTTMHDFYSQGRVAIVQGVDYPDHSYSHFVSTDIWQSGFPQLPSSGWLGRHIDRAPPADGELRGLGIGLELPLILTGQELQGVEVASIESTRFMDGTGALGDARHDALARFAAHPSAEPLRSYAGIKARETVELVRALEGVAPPPKTQNGLANSLLTARALLELDFGVECVFVTQPGSYDTHTSQVAAHEQLLTSLDRALEAFYLGTHGGVPVGSIGPLAPLVADRTLVVTISEFGRRVGENGAGTVAGTDHGAAAPLFIVGPPQDATSAGVRLVPGFHGDHPPMGTPSDPEDNLVQTTELRRVYQSMLQEWLADPDPAYEGPYDPISGLFATP